jgi:hypothetical protein
MNHILSKLFGSPGRVKIMRLFLLNPEEILKPKEISKRAKVTSEATKREISMLSKIGFVAKKKGFIEIETKKGLKKKKIEGWSLDESFPLLFQLKKLVLNSSLLSKKELSKKICKSGRIKFIALAGIFIQEDNSRVDILVVGDSIRRNVLEIALKQIEAEIGKELNYAVFSTKDFHYRLNIYDKFVRDILDYPHEKLLNKLDI